MKLYEEMSFDKLSDVTAMLYKFLNSTKGPAAIYTHCEVCQYTKQPLKQEVYLCANAVCTHNRLEWTEQERSAGHTT